MDTDTIFALATAQGKAGVAIVRVSGPAVTEVAAQLCGGLPRPHVASLRAVTGPAGLIDQGLIVYFPRGASFTGEEVVEFQTHGSMAVTAALLSALAKIPGCRLAEPGEFTRRALENNQLDLAQIEGLADLVEAETDLQRRQALAVFSGALSDRTAQWRRDLIRAVSLLEATIDFADEDVPVDVSPEVMELSQAVLASLKEQMRSHTASERVRNGFEVAIVGAPNVGKSTLLNMLAGREAAITSDVAGTTRDVIEVRMDIAGMAVTLLDTAGIRETIDIVEKIGVARAVDRAMSADLRVFLGPPPEGLTVSPGDVVLRPKVDQDDGVSLGISGRTGFGVDELIQSIGATLSARVSDAGLMIRTRHVTAVSRASDGIQAALPMIAQGQDMAELASEELRSAIRALDSLIGRVDVENILDEIFASFCLGK